MLLGSKWRDVSSLLVAKEKEVKDQELKVEEINSQKIPLIARSLN